MESLLRGVLAGLVVAFHAQQIVPERNSAQCDRMHIRLLPEKWKAWLDREDLQIEAYDGTAEELVARQSRDDLDIQEAQLAMANSEYR